MSHNLVCIHVCGSLIFQQLLFPSASSLSLSPLVTRITAATAQVNIDMNHKMNTNPSYDCVLFGTARQPTTSKGGRTTQVKMDTNPSYDCVSLSTARQTVTNKTATTPQVKTGINPSYDSVTFSTARQHVTSTDAIDTNMNYCYSTLPTAMPEKELNS